ncbi:helix-turn-helix domain-containing protein [Streptomyces marianii]|uniref:Helix-turn-helix transcriptional regulator n=1 Tax=Streptomyces marianii TaxID=1817406 RepID=A0A5R9E5M3_9ACTN|nr:helix-turn-helix transcriptional regulator [Streptomyces marianii]TLQ45310.1 helix-turn-helix transcriptional regulator [Streptomyces marianii]
MGELVKLFRGLADMTQRDLAERLLMSESLLGAYERAERIPTTAFLVESDAALGAKGVLASCVAMMEEEKYSPKFLSWVRTVVDAASFSAYETMVVPGLLQTPAYARALYEVRVPAYEAEETDRYVEARLELQAMLDRKPRPTISYVVEESAFLRPIGGEAVLKEQLRHLIDSVRARNHLTVQVMPTQRSVHAGLHGPLQLLSTLEGRNLGLAEGHGGDTLISKPEEVNRLIDLFGVLRAQALTPWDSVDLIERMAAKL